MELDDTKESSLVGFYNLHLNNIPYILHEGFYFNSNLVYPKLKYRVYFSIDGNKVFKMGLYYS